MEKQTTKSNQHKKLKANKPTKQNPLVNKTKSPGKQKTPTTICLLVHTSGLKLPAHCFKQETASVCGVFYYCE